MYAIPREIRRGQGLEPSRGELAVYKEIWQISKSPLGYNSVDDFVVLSGYNPDSVYQHLTWLTKNGKVRMNVDRMGRAVYIKLLENASVQPW